MARGNGGIASSPAAMRLRACLAREGVSKSCARQAMLDGVGEQNKLAAPSLILKGWGPMDSFEFNKIAGAVLSALLIAFGSSTLIELMGAQHSGHEKPGYELEVKTASADPGAGASAASPRAPAAPSGWCRCR